MTGIKNTNHIPVLLTEVIESLNIKPKEWYVDGTFGFGGHSKVIIQRGGNVLGMDQDSQVIAQVRLTYSQEIKQNRLILENANFSTLKDIAAKHQIVPSGILLDLGYSSWQLDESGRGFSFLKNEILDMRMDPQNQAVRACDLINGLYEKELWQMITNFGEDPLAKQIAKKIVEKRKLGKIETTIQLGTIVNDVYRHYYRGKSLKNPATKTFQALRIVVNDEINVLEKGLQAAMEILKPNGNLAVITFHGLEDRLIKQRFAQWSKDGLGKNYYKKPIYPSALELSENPRSHSAKLRVFSKQ